MHYYRVLFTLLTLCSTIGAMDNPARCVTLHQAVSDKSTEEIKNCLDRDTSCINAFNEQGMTALHLAAYHNFSEGARILLLAGASHLPSRSKNPETPLVIAVRRGNVQVAGTLIELGALNKTSPAEISTLFDMVIRNRDAHMLDLLRNIKLEDKNLDLKKISNDIVTKKLSSHTTNGRTPLHEAVALNFTELVQEVIASGAREQIHELTQEGLRETPLHYATRLGHLETARLLLQNGADPEALNVGSETPLSGAEQSRAEFIRLFILFGFPLTANISKEIEQIDDERKKIAHDETENPDEAEKPVFNDPLEMAAATCNSEKIKKLLKDAKEKSLHETAEYQEILSSALAFATGQGCVVAVNELLNELPQPDLALRVLAAIRARSCDAAKRGNNALSDRYNPVAQCLKDHFQELSNILLNTPSSYTSVLPRELITDYFFRLIGMPQGFRPPAPIQQARPQSPPQ